eukprot:5053759-Ditylum_brightwellii.AAC.1
MKYGHNLPKRPQHSPHKHTLIQYGAKSQIVQTDQSDPLTAKEIKVVQDIIGTFLFYGSSVDQTLTATLSTIASQQADATEATLKA